MQKDNSTFTEKIRLRNSALSLIDNPVVMETHGGLGKVWERVYYRIPAGIVIEKDPMRTELLAHQRPTWAVYEGDSAKALLAGVGSHLEINLLDVDPYGSPWDVIDAFLSSDRPRVPTLHVVVNDGNRQNVQVTGGWNNGAMKDLIDKFGNGLHSSYLECCQLLMDEKATKAGYSLRRWHGYYCGKNQGMTHYWAVLDQN
jgi:hypothetical protein